MDTDTKEQGQDCPPQRPGLLPSESARICCCNKSQSSNGSNTVISLSLENAHTAGILHWPVALPTDGSRTQAASVGGSAIL